MIEEEIKNPENFIRNNNKWFKAEQEKAKKCKMSVDEVIKKDATWIIKMKLEKEKEKGKERIE